MDNDNGTTGLLVSAAGSVTGWGYLAFMQYVTDATTILHGVTAFFVCVTTIFTCLFAAYKWRYRRRFKNELLVKERE